MTKQEDINTWRWEASALRKRDLAPDESAEPDESWAEGERLSDALDAFFAAAEKERS